MPCDQDAELPWDLLADPISCTHGKLMLPIFSVGKISFQVHSASVSPRVDHARDAVRSVDLEPEDGGIRHHAGVSDGLGLRDLDVLTSGLVVCHGLTGAVRQAMIAGDQVVLAAFEVVLARPLTWLPHGGGMAH